MEWFGRIFSGVSNCQNFPFRTVKIFHFKLSKFSFPNCRNFSFQTVKIVCKAASSSKQQHLTVILVALVDSTTSPSCSRPSSVLLHTAPTSLSTFDVDPLMFLLIPSEPSLSNFDASHDVSADLSQHPSLSTLDVIHWCYSNWSFTATHPVDLDVFFCILARCFPLTVTGTCSAGQTLTIAGAITCLQSSILIQAAASRCYQRPQPTHLPSPVEFHTTSICLSCKSRWGDWEVFPALAVDETLLRCLDHY